MVPDSDPSATPEPWTRRRQTRRVFGGIAGASAALTLLGIALHASTHLITLAFAPGFAAMTYLRLVRPGEEWRGPALLSDIADDLHQRPRRSDA